MAGNALHGILRWLVPQLRTPLLTLLLFANVALHVGYLLPLALLGPLPNGGRRRIRHGRTACPDGAAAVPADASG